MWLLVLVGEIKAMKGLITSCNGGN